MKMDDGILENCYKRKLLEQEIKMLKSRVEALEGQLNQNRLVQKPPVYEQKKALNGYEIKFYEYKEKYRLWNEIDLRAVQMPDRKQLVSVVLPVYNGEDYIRLSVESVLQQTYENFELILIDDGSTDGTVQIADAYACLDSRIKVFHQPNRKLPKTLSRGFRMARGEFLTWTSADNIMHPTFLEEFVRQMKKYPDVDMFYGNMKLIDEDGKDLTTFDWHPQAGHPENVMLPESILELNVYPSNYIGAAFMYRYGVAQIAGDYAAGRYGIEDYDYWMKVNDLFTVRHVDFLEPLYSYRIHAKSLTSQDKELKITENRYLTMSWDNTRRDYFLKPSVWVFRECRACLAPLREKLKKHLKKCGHIVMSMDDIRDCSSEHDQNIVVIDLGQESLEAVENLSFRVFTVLILEHPVKFQEMNRYSCYISLNAVGSDDWISDYKGWFGIWNVEQMAAFIHGKAQVARLADLECSLEEEGKADFSILILSNGKLEALTNCLKRIYEARESGIEVIVVASKQNIGTICPAAEQFQETIFLGCTSDREVDMLNFGIWNSHGEYIMFLAEDCSIMQTYFHEFRKMFEASGSLGAVCGSVSYRNAAKKTLLRSHEFSVKETDVLIDDEIYELGCVNITFRNKLLKRLGGLQEAVPGSGMDLADISIQAALRCFEKYGWHILAVKEGGVVRDYAPDLLLSQKHTRLLTNYLMNKNLAVEKYTDQAYIQALLYKKERIEFRYILHDAKRTADLDADTVRWQYTRRDAEKRTEYSDNGQVTVSVIVPVYNVREYLEKCLASLLVQTFPDYEIILVDDGSTDGSAELCDTYAKTDERIRVFHKQNGGLSDARNYGILRANGEYVFFIDSDDWIDKDTLQKLYQIARDYHADIAECSYRNIYADGIKEETDNTGLVITGDSVFALRNQMNWKYFKSVAWNKLYKRKLFRKENMYPVGRYHEDEFTTHKLFWEAAHLVYLDQSLYNYNHTRDGSITGTVTSKILDSCFALRERVSFICSHHITELEKKVKNLYCWMLFDRIRKCYQAGVDDQRLKELLHLLYEEYDEVAGWDISDRNKYDYLMLASSYEAFNRKKDQEEQSCQE